MQEKKYKFHKIAESITELQFGENNLLEIEVAGKHICIANTSKGLAACNLKCPHAGGKMSEGFLDKNNCIVCPVHRYAFNFVNGRDVTGEGYFLKTYPVLEDNSGIFIGVEESGFLSWLK